MALRDPFARRFRFLNPLCVRPVAGGALAAADVAFGVAHPAFGWPVRG